MSASGTLPSIPALVYAHAARPSAVALLDGERPVTYRTLCAASDAIAADLGERGVRAGQVVPILMDRSAELIAAMLGVLRLGAGYAALDLAWPRHRQDTLIATTGSSLVITDRTDRTGGYRPGRVDELAARATVPPPVEVSGSAVATVFFTSGSTGEPKGVLSPHSGTTRLFRPGTFARFGPRTVMPSAAPLPWDAHSLELWGVLLTGGTSVLASEPPLLPDRLRAMVARGANSVWLTAALFHLVVEEDPGAFAGLDQVMTGGDRVSGEHAARFLRAYPTTRLINGYGPVESTIFATTHRIRPPDCADPHGVPIGRPVPHTGVHLLDGDRPCRPGEVGEICLSGAGLATGYLDDPDLTAKRFVDIELDGAPRRVYRTGDLGRMKEGLLYFRGRLDRQVKIQGHRIEPLEIEREIRRLDDVRDCVVLPVPSDRGEARLVAFYTTRSARPADHTILATLRGRMPAYLVPHRMRHLSSLPMTGNGKVDQALLVAGLTEPEVIRPSTGDETSAMVDEVFRLTLGAERVAPDESFFTLGGSSLDAARACGELTRRAGVPVPFPRFVQLASVSALAGWLRAASKIPAVGAAAPMDPPAVGAAAPMTAAQTGIWVSQARDADDLSTLCPMAWWIRGPLNAAALAAAVADVHHRHEALRSRYLFVDEPLVSPGMVPPPPVSRLPDIADPRAAECAALDYLLRPLDIEAGQVWRACLIREGSAGEHLFALAVHHVALDGRAEPILAGDLSAAYAARCAGTPPHFDRPAPSSRVVHREYARQRDEARLPQQRNYWRSTLAGLPALSVPPPPRPGPPGCASVDLTLSAAQLRPWLRAARERGTVRFAAVLGLVAAGLAGATGQRDFAIGTPVSRRSTPALADALACLIDTLCVRLRLPPPVVDPAQAADVVGISGIVPDIVGIADDALRGALAAADVPLDEVVDLADAHSNSRHPLFQAMVVLQDAARPELDLAQCVSTFFRPDPPRAVAELVIEAEPLADGGWRLHVTYRPDLVCDRFVAAVLERVRWLCRHVRSAAGRDSDSREQQPGSGASEDSGQQAVAEGEGASP